MLQTHLECLEQDMKRNEADLEGNKASSKALDGMNAALRQQIAAQRLSREEVDQLLATLCAPAVCGCGVMCIAQSRCWFVYVHDLAHICLRWSLCCAWSIGHLGRTAQPYNRFARRPHTEGAIAKSRPLT